MEKNLVWKAFEAHTVYCTADRAYSCFVGHDLMMKAGQPTGSVRRKKCPTHNLKFLYS